MNRIATIVSNIFDPVPMILLLGIFAVVATPLSTRAMQTWLVLMVCMAIAVIAIMAWFLRRGYVFDARLGHGEDQQRDRLGILFIVNGLLFVADVLAWSTARPEPLSSILFGMTVVMVLATIITIFYKISFHMIGVTSIAVVIVLTMGLVTWPVLLILPIVAWSRRVLKRHTVGQLFFGTILPIGVFLATFYATGQLFQS